jgi:hypothetical protein
MTAQVNSAEPSLLRLLRLVVSALILVAPIGCGGDDDDGVHTTPMPRDAGGEEDGGGGDFEIDGDVPLPMAPDAGRAIPGDPPPELEDSQCAVDTNKLYALATLDRPPVPMQLAVDPIESHFGAVFIGDSEQCIDALYLADIHGAAGVGEPEVTMVADECTTVTHAALAHTGEHWLLGMVDARMDSYDVWVQAHRSGSEPHRVSENLGQENQLQLAVVGSGKDATLAVMAAWVERDADTGATSLNVRPLSLDGEPTGDVVVIEPAGMYSFTSVSLARVGPRYAGLAYMRSDGMGANEIVFDVLSIETGERDRDPWVLTGQAGPFGTVDLGTDPQFCRRGACVDSDAPEIDEGGGLIYSAGEGDSRQLWIQRIDQNGEAATLMSGGSLGGAAPPERVVGPPYKATDASIVKLGVGFAVAYRALPGGMVTSPRIRVHFLDRLGSEEGKSDVALASEFGGRTAIEVALDGRITLGWTDTDEDGTSTLTVVKLPCVGGG